MPRYALAFDGEPIATFIFGDGIADDNDRRICRDEFDGLKALERRSVHFSFGLAVKDQLPPLDHDALDGIALEQVNGKGFIPAALKAQAKRRVEERGLCR